MPLHSAIYCIYRPSVLFIVSPKGTLRQREERKDFKKVIVKNHAVMIIMPSETDVAPKAMSGWMDG